MTRAERASRLSSALLAEAARCASVYDTARGTVARGLSRRAAACCIAFLDDKTPPAQRRHDVRRWRLVEAAARAFLQPA